MISLILGFCFDCFYVRDFFFLLVSFSKDFTYCILFVHVFLEGIHDFIELSHPSVKEFRVNHLSFNKMKSNTTPMFILYSVLLQPVLGMGLGELQV